MNSVTKKIETQRTSNCKMVCFEEYVLCAMSQAPWHINTQPKDGHRFEQQLHIPEERYYGKKNKNGIEILKRQ